MKSVVFTSNSEKKLTLLIQVAAEMGITNYKEGDDLTDEEMALPGRAPSREKLEHWLAKDEGEFSTVEEAFGRIRKSVSESRRKKK